jgi:hypothetical protein
MFQSKVSHVFHAPCFSQNDHLGQCGHFRQIKFSKKSHFFVVISEYIALEPDYLNQCMQYCNVHALEKRDLPSFAIH